jgi:hypothetical protein
VRGAEGDEFWVAVEAERRGGKVEPLQPKPSHIMGVVSLSSRTCSHCKQSSIAGRPKLSKGGRDLRSDLPKSKLNSLWMKLPSLALL